MFSKRVYLQVWPPPLVQGAFDTITNAAEIAYAIRLLKKGN